MKAAIHPRPHPCAIALLGLCLCAPRLAAAGPDDDWHFRANVYGFFPEIGGHVRAPIPGGGQIDVDAQDLIDRLKFAAMGGVEAQKGRWGLFADAVYMNVGDSISNSSTIGRGTVALPPGVTASASLDVKALAFTLAANYRLVSTPDDTFDVFGGARLIDATTELDWRFDTPMGPLPPPQGQGRSEAGHDGWDGIVGIKGRHRFGARGEWFVPYYADAGTGSSDFTWQAATGIGYSAGWGETFLVWRHLDYDFGRSQMIEDLSFSGPALGVAFNW